MYLSIVGITLTHTHARTHVCARARMNCLRNLVFNLFVYLSVSQFFCPNFCVGRLQQMAHVRWNILGKNYGFKLLWSFFYPPGKQISLFYDISFLTDSVFNALVSHKCGPSAMRGVGTWYDLWSNGSIFTTISNLKLRLRRNNADLNFCGQFEEKIMY